MKSLLCFLKIYDGNGMKPDLPPNVEIVDSFSFSSEGILFILILFINVLWYYIKGVVKSKGYPMNLFFGHGRDIRFMREVIANEQSKEKATHYKTVLYSLYMCVAGIILLILFNILFINP